MTLPATAFPFEIPPAFLGVSRSSTGKLWRDRLDGRGAARALAIAQRYEEMGGQAIYAGKPHPPIYAQALGLAAGLRGRSTPDARILAIGDAMRTDVAGAVQQGIDVLFVTAGIHGEELQGDGPMAAAALEQFSARHGLWPKAAIRDLVW